MPELPVGAGLNYVNLQFSRKSKKRTKIQFSLSTNSGKSTSNNSPKTPKNQKISSSSKGISKPRPHRYHTRTNTK